MKMMIHKQDKTTKRYGPDLGSSHCSQSSLGSRLISEEDKEEVKQRLDSNNNSFAADEEQEEQKEDRQSYSEFSGSNGSDLGEEESPINDKLKWSKVMHTKTKPTGSDDEQTGITERLLASAAEEDEDRPSYFYSLQGSFNDRFSFYQQQERLDHGDNDQLWRKYQKLRFKIRLLKKELQRVPQDSPDRQAVMKNLRKASRQLWRLDGVRSHNLNVDELNNVIRRLMRFGRVPEGYLYPELIRTKEQSKDMQEMELRKQLHLNNKNREEENKAALQMP